MDRRTIGAALRGYKENRGKPRLLPELPRLLTLRGGMAGDTVRAFKPTLRIDRCRWTSRLLRALRAWHG
jgi:hypothetical protein